MLHRKIFSTAHYYRNIYHIMYLGIVHNLGTIPMALHVVVVLDIAVGYFYQAIVRVN